jgi:DNA-binding CsgD family transcriptional regulator
MEAGLSRLAERDLRRALATVQALAAEEGDSAAFVRAVLDELPRIVASDLTTLSLCDLRAGTRRVVGRQAEALSDADRAAFDHHFHEHPLVRFHGSHPAGPTQRISDCLSPRRFRDSAVFADYYRRIGISFVMALPLRIDEASVISIVLNRSRADFADRERALLDALRRPLAGLYRNLIAREEAGAGLAGLRELALANGWMVARVQVDGAILDIAEPALRLLDRYFGHAVGRRRATLPAPLLEWLRRSRHWGLDRLASRDGEAFLAARGGMRLTVHFVPGPAAGGRGYLLMKEEREALRAEHLASLPLTAREREILALVAAGKTNIEIGLVLAISARTVQKHLEHVFQKIGVETRTAAAVCALTAAGAAREQPA